MLHAPRPPKMLRPFRAFGTWPLATYFPATGDNLHATAASNLHDSPVDQFYQPQTTDMSF